MYSERTRLKFPLTTRWLFSKRKPRRAMSSLIMTTSEQESTLSTTAEKLALLREHLSLPNGKLKGLLITGSDCTLEFSTGIIEFKISSIKLDVSITPSVIDDF